MAKTEKPPRDPAVLAPECGNCGGVECGTAQVPVCCGSCTHT